MAAALWTFDWHLSGQIRPSMSTADNSQESRLKRSAFTCSFVSRFSQLEVMVQMTDTSYSQWGSKNKDMLFQSVIYSQNKEFSTNINITHGLND